MSETLREAIAMHQRMKRKAALPGTIDQFDIELWSVLRNESEDDHEGETNA